MNGMFCQKCGSLMVLNNEKKKANCSSCGYSPRGKVENLILKENLKLLK